MKKGYLKTLNNIASKIPVIGVIYILLYRYILFRSICKGISIYLCSWFPFINLSMIRNIYFCVENIIRLFIIISIFIICIYHLYQIPLTIFIKKQKGKGRFEENLFRYLHDDIPHSFLLTGSWGSGKTYEVNLFFNKYYKNSIQKIYRISCFGLSTRKELLDEISKVIEEQDRTFSKVLVDIIIYLPFLGQILSKLLKKSYSYTTAKKGSIFVFDDFERISSYFALSSEKITPLYKPSSFISDRVRQGLPHSGLDRDFEKEFKNIAKAFNNIQSTVRESESSYHMDKYISVVGVMNELVEVYGMKVIIICNTNIVNQKFINDILRSKLNCIEYKKTITRDMQQSIIEDVLNRNVFTDEIKEKKIQSFKQKIEGWAIKHSEDLFFDDLRLEISFLQAFVDTVNLFDEDMLSDDFLVSLYNSILVAHIAYYNGLINELEYFENGSYIPFMFGLFSIQFREGIYLDIHHDPQGFKWVHVNASAYWILSLSEPSKSVIRNIYDGWRSYQYCDLEYRLCKNPFSLFETDQYGYIHLLYCRKHDEIQSSNFSNQEFIKKALCEFDVSRQEDIQYILDITQHVFGSRFFDDFLQNMFPCISIANVKNIEGNSHVHKEFLHYMDKLKGEEQS